MRTNDDDTRCTQSIAKNKEKFQVLLNVFVPSNTLYIRINRYYHKMCSPTNLEKYFNRTTR